MKQKKLVALGALSIVFVNSVFGSFQKTLITQPGNTVPLTALAIKSTHHQSLYKKHPWIIGGISTLGIGAIGYGIYQLASKNNKTNKTNNTDFNQAETPFNDFSALFQTRRNLNDPRLKKKLEEKLNKQNKKQSVEELINSLPGNNNSKIEDIQKKLQESNENSQDIQPLKTNNKNEQDSQDQEDLKKILNSKNKKQTLEELLKNLPSADVLRKLSGDNNSKKNEQNSTSWETINNAETIATELESVLKKDIGDSLTNEQITKLKEESDTDVMGTLETTLVRHATIPADATLYLFGDLHGDFGPLDALLKKLSAEKLFSYDTWKLDEKIYIGGLGDYIDRGPDSLKNLYHLWKLKDANQEQVFLIRGNHEASSGSTFGTPWKGTLFKLSSTQYQAVYKKFLAAFALLPIVALIDREGKKNSRIALVHGGIAPTHKQALIAENQKFNCVESGTQTEEFLKKTITTSTYDAISYLWSDLVKNDTTKKDTSNQKRGGAGNALCKKSVQNWMKTNNVQTIFHGHDQSKKEITENGKTYELFTQGKWRGLGSRWNDSAIVLNVAPNTQYYNTLTKGRFYDDYGVIACIEPKPANFVAQTTTDKTHAENGVAQEIKTLDGYILEPIYFDPFTHEIVQDILEQNPQDKNPNNQPNNK